jgi:hypothetical protein
MIRRKDMNRALVRTALVLGIAGAETAAPTAGATKCSSRCRNPSPAAACGHRSTPTLEGPGFNRGIQLNELVSQVDYACVAKMEEIMGTLRRTLVETGRAANTVAAGCRRPDPGYGARAEYSAGGSPGTKGFG